MNNINTILSREVMMRFKILLYLLIIYIFHFCLINISICADLKPNIIEFKASSQSVRGGDSIILSWRVENANSVMISGIGAVFPSGMKEITINSKTDVLYKITAANSNGTSEKTVIIKIKSKIEQQIIFGSPENDKVIDIISTPDKGYLMLCKNPEKTNALIYFNSFMLIKLKPNLEIEWNKVYDIENIGKLINLVNLKDNEHVALLQQSNIYNCRAVFVRINNIGDIIDVIFYEKFEGSRHNNRVRIEPIVARALNDSIYLLNIQKDKVYLTIFDNSLKPQKEILIDSQIMNDENIKNMNFYIFDNKSFLISCNTSSDIILVKYSADGKHEWETIVGKNSNSDEICYNVFNCNNAFFIIGEMDSHSGPRKPFLALLNNTGIIQQLYICDNLNNITLINGVIDSNDNIYIMGNLMDMYKEKKKVVKEKNTIYLAKYSKNLKLLFYKKYLSKPPHNSFDEYLKYIEIISNIKLINNSELLIFGNMITEYNRDDYLIMIIDSNGNIVVR